MSAAVPPGAGPVPPPAAEAAGSSASSPPEPAGLVLRPFRGLRPDPVVVGDVAAVTSPPYDVVSDAARDALERQSPHNVVRLILPRDEGTAGDRYAAAARRLEQWRADGALAPDGPPALYVYEQAEPGGGAVQRGLVGAIDLVRPDAGVVLPHEDTMSGPVEDRLALYEAVGADLEPVFLVHDSSGSGAAARVVADAPMRPPLADVTTDDGVRHRLWAVTDPALLREVDADLRPRRAVIADGHHRWATMLQRQARRRAAGGGAGPWDQGLVYLVDTAVSGPRVEPIHRVVRGRRADELAGAAGAVAVVEDVSAAGLPGALDRLAEATGAAFLLASPDAGSLHLVSEVSRDAVDQAVPADRSTAWRELEVTVLHHLLVARAWALPDEPGTVGFEHSVQEALEAAGHADGTAVLLRPTPVAAVAAVAAAGDRMPRKSTLFLPKPRSGLLLRDHRDA